MGEAPNKAGADEWRGYWYLPLVAALGFTAAGLQLYALGPFVEPLQNEFGWSRAQIYFGLTITNGVSALLNLLMGIIVDRIGPRRVGLIGILLVSGAFALLGTATGSTANWILLWGLLAIGVAWIQPTTWCSAVASRFEVSRGLALGVTLCGVSVSALILPRLSTMLIEALGWRSAFFSIGLIWMAIVFPTLFLFFRGKQDSRGKVGPRTEPAAAQFPGLSVREALRTTVFYKLLLAGGLFSFTIVGIATNLVPLLTDQGTDRMTAADIASLIGLFAIVGRLSTGFLLDRFPGPVVGAAAFLLPTLGCALLLWNGAGNAGHAVASAVIGLSLGAELDALTFLALRYFGLRSFGTLYGGLLIAISIGTAIGPALAGRIFDEVGDYSPFLIMGATFMTLSALALLSLRGTREYRPEPLATAPA